MGLAMEHFNVTGQWRKTDGGRPIMTGGRMPSGEPFADFMEMKHHLLTRQDRMIESMVGALIAYSLGRDAEFSDRDFIEDVARQTRASGYQFRALLKAFVRHHKFTHQ
jgi:hypothetical protein